MPAEWHERSFFLEVKPRTDLASLFVDCPPNGDGDEKENNCLDMVRVGEHSVELGLPDAIAERLLPTSKLLNKYCARISGLYLAPDSVCSPTWADNKRLFMCKVRAGKENNQPLVPKQFHRLAKDITPVEPVQQFIEEFNGKDVQLHCNQCNFSLMTSDHEKITLGWLPSDDWMQTSQAADYYCRDSCGASCDPHKHGHHRNGLESEGVHREWLPSSSRIMLSNSYIVLVQEISGDRIFLENKKALCAGCHAELGTLVPNKSDMFMVHHATVDLSVGGKKFLEERFSDRSIFFTQLLLSSCESKSSLKLVIRSLNKTPHILVWLLDSYVLLAAGDLQAVARTSENSSNSDNGNTKGNNNRNSKNNTSSNSSNTSSTSTLPTSSTIEEVKPFPAIKMLYKVFDAETAASDPRANGEDASVGLIDLPLPCCVQLIENLLLSSHALPPACRSVGQFYVGFLRLADTI